MHLKQLKIFPFHLLLLPVFFVWHVVNQYYGLMPLGYSSRFLFYYLALAIFLFFTGKLLLGNAIKAACWATGLLIIFFFWGAAHDFLRSLHLPAFLLSYKFLLPFVLIIVAFLTISLRKKKSPPFKANCFLTLLFLLFLAAEAALSIFNLAKRQAAKNNLAYYKTPPTFNPVSTGNESKPDIFLVVLDEYASSASLLKYLHYDNSPLDSLLAAHRFYQATQAQSNYNSTPLSVSSFLDLDYFDRPLEGKLADPLIILKGQETIKKSILPGFLEKQGYRIINLGLCDLQNHPAPAESFFNNNVTEALYLETLWGRIQREIWWNVRQKTPLSWTLLPASKQADILESNLRNYASSLEELNKQTGPPKFVLVHLMMPHRPFFFDSNGKRRPHPYADPPALDDSLYIDQLIHTNTWISSLVNAATSNTRRPRVVVLAGDHGYRDKLNEAATRDKQFMNLCAFYFSDRDYSGLYDRISPVNSFRVILNKYFHTDLPLLKDSTIRLVE